MLVSIKICNCNHIKHVISYYIQPKCCEEKEPKDEQLCMTVHTINNICDINPLNNSGKKHTKASTAIHTITDYSIFVLPSNFWFYCTTDVLCYLL